MKNYVTTVLLLVTSLMISPFHSLFAEQNLLTIELNNQQWVEEKHKCKFFGNNSYENFWKLRSTDKKNKNEQIHLLASSNIKTSPKVWVEHYKKFLTKQLKKDRQLTFTTVSVDKNSAIFTWTISQKDRVIRYEIGRIEYIQSEFWVITLEVKSIDEKPENIKEKMDSLMKELQDLNIRNYFPYEKKFR